MQKYIILNLYQPIDMYERLSRAKKKKKSTNLQNVVHGHKLIR